MPDIHKAAYDAMEWHEFEKMVMAMMIEHQKIDDEIGKRLSEIEKCIGLLVRQS